jgi:K+-sensing histidine kinase KdpD
VLPPQFLANLSHDFKNPLTSLKMAVHLILEDSSLPPAPSHRALLTTAAEDIDRLYALIVEHLDKPRAAS